LFFCIKNIVIAAVITTVCGIFYFCILLHEKTSLPALEKTTEKEEISVIFLLLPLGIDYR